MKKLIIFFLVFTSACFLFGSDLIGVGYGKTIESAKEQALRELGNNLYGSRINSTETLRKYFSDNFSRTTATSEITVNFRGTLYGLEYEERREGKEFRVIARLKDTPEIVEFYSLRMKVIEGIIEGIFASMPRVEFNKTVYDAYLKSLFAYSSEYEACALILLYFKESPSIKADYTTEMIYSLY